MITVPCEIAEHLIRNYAVDRLDKSDGDVEFDVYVVWYNYTLGNWKCLLSTTLPDGMYYEVTYNKATNDIYLDAYKKFDHRELPHRLEL